MSLRQRPGALLPTVLAVMVLIGLAASAALYLVRQERGTAVATLLQAAVTSAADEAETHAALSAMSRRSPLGVGQGSTLSIPVGNSGVHATARLTRLGSSTFSLVIAARAEDAAGRMARRRSSLLLHLHPAALELPAALSLTTAVDAPPGIADGNDRPPDQWECAADSTVPDVLHPLTPPADGAELQRFREGAAVRLAPGSSVIAPTPVVQDGACDTRAPTNWGDPARATACAHWFPVVHAAGDLRVLGGTGQGVLLVDGNLELSGDFTWAGAVIVAGRITLGPGAPRIVGGVRAAEIVDVGGAAASGAVIARSSCALRAALLAAGTMAAAGQRPWAVER